MSATPSALSPELNLFCRLSACVAIHDAEPMRESIATALDAGYDVLRIKEVILQNYLFSGFPSAIEGLIVLGATLKHRGIADNNWVEMRTEEQIKSDGMTLCAMIYDKNFDKLMHNMQSLSTDIRDWMIFEGYGKVLSRPILTAKERELCVISALAAMGRERQLISHLRGAVHVGASDGEISEALQSISQTAARGKFSEAMRLWDETRSRS